MPPFGFGQKGNASHSLCDAGALACGGIPQEPQPRAAVPHFVRLVNFYRFLPFGQHFADSSGCDSGYFER